MSMKTICGHSILDPNMLFDEYIVDFEKVMRGCIINDSNYEELLKNSTVIIDKQLLIDNDIKIIKLPVGLHFYNFEKYMIVIKTHDINTFKIEDFAYIYSVSKDTIRGVTKAEINKIEQGL